MKGVLSIKAKLLEVMFVNLTHLIKYILFYKELRL